MSGCGCHDHGASLPPQHVGNGVMAIVKKKPCTACAQAAAAIASTIPVEEGGTRRMSGAPDDLFTIQAFLQSLTSGVSPTPSELAQAQAAAESLSVSIATRQAVDSSIMKPLSIALMLVGALAVGAGTAYILNGRKG